MGGQILSARFLPWNVSIVAIQAFLIASLFSLDGFSQLRKDFPIIASRFRKYWGWKYLVGFSGFLYAVGVAVMQLIGDFQIARIILGLAVCVFFLTIFISNTKGTSWTSKFVVLGIIGPVAWVVTSVSFRWIRRAEDAQISKDNQIARQEFLLHRSDTIKQAINFQVRLDRLYYPEDLGSYKISAQLVSREGVIWINSYFPAKGHLFYNGVEQKNNSQNLVWMLRGNDYSTLQDTALGWYYRNTYRLESYFAPRPNTVLQTLGDLDGVRVNLWVNEALVSKITYVSMWADEYLLLGLPTKCFDTTDVYKPAWPEPILGDVRKEWSSENWIQLVPHGFRSNGPAPPVFNFPISFEDYTPPTTRKFASLKDSLKMAVPNYTFCGP